MGGRMPVPLFSTGLNLLQGCPMSRSCAHRLIGFLLLMPFFTACSVVPAPTSTLVPATATLALPTPTPQPTALPKPIGAFESGQYRNLFTELLGKSEAEVQRKIEQAWGQLFYGDDDTQRVYYPVGRDTAYIKDIANDDVRTEGMSYGMMLAVQLDKQEEFDKVIVAYSRLPQLDDLLQRIAAYPEAGRAEKIRSFYAQLLAMQ